MSLTRPSKSKLRLGVVIVAIPLMVFGLYRFILPFGPRHCTVPCMVMALEIYKADHGHYPSGEKVAVDNLKKLSNYTSFHILAGLSGDVKRTQQAIQKGETIVGITSWGYNPEAKTGEVLIWDRTTNTDFGGRRKLEAGYHIGFTGGTWKRVSVEEAKSLGIID